MRETKMSLIQDLVPPVVHVIVEHAQELTQLDQAIGDGDHGINMRRGAEKILQELPNLAGKSDGDAMKAMGMALVMSVGGASGPLFGSLLMEMGKALGDRPMDKDAVAACFASGIEAVKKRGRSDVGQKTMLDVLVPALAVVKSEQFGAGLYASLKTAVAVSEERTIAMKALAGRASYLGERSIGHMDPGARSCGLAIRAICKVLEAADNG